MHIFRITIEATFQSGTLFMYTDVLDVNTGKKLLPTSKQERAETLATVERDIKPDSYQLLVIIDQGVIFVTISLTYNL